MSGLCRQLIVLSCFLALAAGCAKSPTAAVEETKGETKLASEAPTITAKDLRVEFEGAADGPVSAVKILGLPEHQLAAFEKMSEGDRAKALQAFVDTAGGGEMPAILGTGSFAHGALVFSPRFPLDNDTNYRIDLNLPGNAGTKAEAPKDGAEKTAEQKTAGYPPVKANLTFKTWAAPPAEPTTVTQIFPTANRLPDNQLKFYLHFSAPMGRGQAYRHVHLVDADGKEVDGAFLELGEELWNPAMTRFTLLFDPGRVKRGLVPREVFGPVLVDGKSYTLKVDRNWPDATGRPLKESFEKKFEAGPPDETPLDVATWKLTAPKAGTSDALEVQFGEPLDRSLLDRVVWVTNSAGEKLAGTIAVGNEETNWRFTPEQPWAAGDYQLVAAKTLEDLAGNAIGRAFDVDVFAPVQKEIATETVSVPFKVE